MASTSTRAASNAARAAQAPAVTASQQLLLAAAKQATPSPMGRLRRNAPAPAPLHGTTGQGNSAVISDRRGQPAAQPGKGAGDGIADASPYPQRLIVTSPSQLLRRARTAAFQHGRSIVPDRRVLGNRGTVMLSGARDTKPGFPDPDSDGPARPAYKQVNRTLSWQIGADSTAFLDNSAPKPMTTDGERPFSLGTRGDPWTTVWGGTPGLAAYRPYGTRGGPGAGAPQPRVKALPGGPYRPGTLLQQGSPNDGPQKFPSGPAWGLHTATVTPAALVQGSQRFRFTTQIARPKQGRPQNSNDAGQSWSQAAVTLSGSKAVKIPRTAASRVPGGAASGRRA
jgi:hypothetical protein